MNDNNVQKLYIYNACPSACPPPRSWQSEFNFPELGHQESHRSDSTAQILALSSTQTRTPSGKVCKGIVSSDSLNLKGMLGIGLKINYPDKTVAGGMGSRVGGILSVGYF